jgi:DNA-binding NarL/FixJ family response regulator
VADARIRASLIDVSPPLGAALERAAAEPEGRRHLEISRVASAAEAARRHAREPVDVVLLPLRGAEEGLQPLIGLRAELPEVPVVVLATAGDEPLAIRAVHLGAADYLLGEQLYGTLLARCLRHAVESQRVRTQLERYDAEWPASLLTEGPGESRAASLRVALPQSFEELVRAYGRILDLAVEQVLYRVEHPLEESVRLLAKRAGDLRAGPRDVVEIHAAAIERSEAGAGPQRMRLYVAEGRLRLLEVMGHLVTYYRQLNLPGRHRGDRR